MRITKAMKSFLPFTVVRDCKEQKGFGWIFKATEIGGYPFCSGTEVAFMETGDYTIKGLEHVLCIERKGTINDLISSLSSGRLADQMKRLSAFPRAYLVLEFDLQAVLDWPTTSIPLRRSGRKVSLTSPDAALSALMSLHFRYPTVQLSFVGTRGRDFLRSIFKRTLEDHAQSQRKSPVRVPRPRPKSRNR